MKCVGLFQRKRKEICCCVCGNKIERQNAKVRKNKTGLFFCSYECLDAGRILKNNSKSSYRNKAIKYYGAKCICCGYKEHVVGLDVHHIDGNRENNNMKNLIVLCVLCHRLVERNILRIDGVNGNTQN